MKEKRFINRLKTSFCVPVLSFFMAFGSSCMLGGATSSSANVGESSLQSNSSVQSDSSMQSDSSSSETLLSNGLEIHFLTLGNETSGDCTLIKTGDVELLNDAGSTRGSSDTIVPYISEYCTDGVLEYVIATHGDEDHIAAFVGDYDDSKDGVFEAFKCQTIIDFPQTTKKTQIYQQYVSLRNAEVKEGATHYTALECWNNANGAKQSYVLAEGITMNILYQKYYEQSNSKENNYSVCMLLSQGENHFLFTGDLESSGESSLVESNDLPKCKLYKAGHHGSNTSSTAKLITKIQPEIVVIPCCCGDKHGFPHQETLDAVAPYTDQVYVPKAGGTLLNGNIVVSSQDGEISVTGSNNSTLFKDTEWFQKNRTIPDEWL